MPQITKQYKFCAAHKYWNDKWDEEQNKRIFDEENNLVSINVVKPGKASGNHEVDGISGATMTCNGLTKFLKNDLNRYINFFKL